MQKTTFLTYSGLFISLFCTAQQFEWAGQIGGNGWDVANKMAKDSSGSIYVTGTFNNSGDFNPGLGTANLTSAGNQDIYLVKLASTGTFKWARRFGGTSTDYGDAIAASNNTDIYIGGKFRGTADFDPGTGTTNLVSAGDDDAYICKVDSAGNLLWAVNAGSTGADDVRALTTDATGNVYAIGLFTGTVDFDPGPGVSQLTATSGDMFIWKLDASGNFVWAQRYGSSPGEFPGDICVDAAGNIHVTGSFYGTVDFDPGAGTFNMNAGSLYDDAFLLKLDASGNFVWAKKFGGSSSNDVGYAMSVDASGCSYITGSFNASGDFDPGTSTYNLTPSGSVDVFIVKLSASGNFIWAKGIGDPNFQQSYDLALHPTGDVYITGMFDGSVDFDPGAGSSIHTSSGGGDIFILQLDSTGNFRWAGRIGDTQTDFGMGIMALNGKLVISGGFTQTADFDPGAGNYPLSSVLNTQDGWVLNVCASYNIPVAAAVCSGDSIYAAGAWQTVSGVYTDSLLSIYGCDSIIITTLTVNAPVVNLGNDTAFCNGGVAVLDATTSGASYQWNTGDTTSTVNADSSGVFAVTITDQLGCTANDSVTITVHALPVVVFSPLSMDTLCLSAAALTLTGGSPSGGSYSGPGVSGGQFDPSVAGAGTHQLYYTYSDSNACAAVDSQIIFVDVCTGISGDQRNEVSVFPNPSTGNVTVLLPEGSGPGQITCYTITGQVILLPSTQTGSNTFVCETESLPPGIYYLEIKSGGMSARVEVVRY